MCIGFCKWRGGIKIISHLYKKCQNNAILWKICDVLLYIDNHPTKTINFLFTRGRDELSILCVEAKNIQCLIYPRI